MKLYKLGLLSLFICMFLIITIINAQESPKISDFNTFNPVDTGLNKQLGITIDLVYNGLTHKELLVNLGDVTLNDEHLSLLISEEFVNPTIKVKKFKSIVKSNYEHKCLGYWFVDTNGSNAYNFNCSKILIEKKNVIKEYWETVDVLFTDKQDNNNMISSYTSGNEFKYSFDVPIREDNNRFGSYGTAWVNFRSMTYVDLQNSSWWNHSVPFKFPIFTNSSGGVGFSSTYLINGTEGVNNMTCWSNSTHTTSDGIAGFLYTNDTNGNEMYIIDPNETIQIPFYCERRGKLSNNFSIPTLFSTAKTVVGFQGSGNTNIHDLIGNFSFTEFGTVAGEVEGAFGDYAMQSSATSGYLNSSFPFGIRYTYALWIQSKATGQEYVVSTTESGDDGAWLNTNNITGIQCAKRGTVSGVAVATVNWADNQFHHIVCRLNGTAGNEVLYIYTDGTLKHQLTIGTPADPTDAIAIGYRHFTGGSGFTGNISHFEFYDRALSGDEILRMNDTFRSVLGARETNVTPDVTPPDITIDDPTNISYNEPSRPLNINVNENSTCTFSLNHGVNASYSTFGTIHNFTISSINQSNRIDVSCNDTSNNLNRSNVAYYINSSPICNFIGNQTWDENTNQTLNLSSFCSDLDGNLTIEYTFINVTGINVTILNNVLTFLPADNFTTTGTSYTVNYTDGVFTNRISNAFQLIVEDVPIPPVADTTTFVALREININILLFLMLALFFVMLLFSEMYGGLYYLATSFIGIGVFMLLFRSVDKFISLPFLLFVIAVTIRMVFKGSIASKS